MKNKKQIRENFRTVVFTRDNFKCLFCEKEAVDAHHITDRNEMPNGGYVKENGISLCAEHHIMAEKFHNTEGKEWHYKKINSSKELAIKCDKNIESGFRRNDID